MEFQSAELCQHSLGNDTGVPAVEALAPPVCEKHGMYIQCIANRARSESLKSLYGRSSTAGWCRLVLHSMQSTTSGLGIWGCISAQVTVDSELRTVSMLPLTVGHPLLPQEGCGTSCIL